MISTMRFGHTGLNITMKMMKKQVTRKCEHCEMSETVELVFLQYPKYREER